MSAVTGSDDTSMRTIVRSMLADLEPLDDIEEEHRERADAWLASTTDITRRVKPDVPDPHLVSYVVPVDTSEHAVFLCAHRLAGLWLPPGGHVEPGEHPAATAAREAEEELGRSVSPTSEPWAPCFLTWTRTRGEGSHIDVSLWFVADESADTAYRVDAGEFSDARWWTVDEIRAADAALFDPHLGRFVAKLRRHDIATNDSDRGLP